MTHYCENGRIYDERWSNGREWFVAWHPCPTCKPVCAPTNKPSARERFRALIRKARVRSVEEGTK